MSRLNSRLAKLERQASPEQVDADSMLVELLAKRDALVYPLRLQNGVNDKLMYRAAGAIKLRIRNYFAGRIGFAARASGQNAWKDAYAQRGHLITSGLATAIRSGGEITALRLTALGESDARALVGSRLKTLRDIDTLRILQRCLERQDEMSQWFGVAAGPARYMCEHLVYGLDEPLSGNPARWEQWTECVLPLITANLMQWSSDAQGRLYFSLTYNAEGKALAELNEIELPPVSTREADPKFDELYMNAFDAERMALENLEGNELFITIPCSGTWMEWQTRAVRMRGAIEYPTYPSHLKHDFSGADRFKTLANEVLADPNATSEERELAVKLLQVISDGTAGYNKKREEFLKTQAAGASNG